MFSSADAYDRFMGRYSMRLAPEFVAFTSVGAGQQVLDVGCGPGAMTTQLVALLGTSSVSAVDPSEPFVAVARDRHPGVDVRLALAEDLPFEDDSFDAALAQLAVHFMSDPLAGVREMKRVARPGGTVAACVWDHSRGPLATFWKAARTLDPDVDDFSWLPGTRPGHLAELFDEAGLDDVEEAILSVEVEHPSFEDWWEPFTLGVGRAGTYVSGLEPERLTELRGQCRHMLPPAPFAVQAEAWAARGIA